MSVAPQVPGIALVCAACGARQNFELDQKQMDELFRKLEVKLSCQVCQAITSWRGAKSDRRSGNDRRAVPQSHIKLPIRVRCALPDLFFVELTYTQTASRRGASFFVRQPVPVDSKIHLVIPFIEGDSTVMELPVRVVHCEKAEHGYKLGVQFLY